LAGTVESKEWMVITLLEATIWFPSINIFKSNYTIIKVNVYYIL
jgi:hypothetical protein